MKITFIGAAHEVTGSCTLIETGKTKFLVDCGMEQGPDMYENRNLPVSIARLVVCHYSFTTFAVYTAQS